MRAPVLAAALFLSAPSAFAASPAPPISDVAVSIGPALADKADEYGEDEIRRLAADLEADVEEALARNGRLRRDGGGRLELVLADAVPNRPTPHQLTATPWLSTRSVGLGGATIEGRLFGPDGSSTPVAYKWYQTDIRFTQGAATWSDAQRAFDRFAEKMARGGD